MNGEFTWAQGSTTSQGYAGKRHDVWRYGGGKFVMGRGSTVLIPWAQWLTTPQNIQGNVMVLALGSRLTLV
jgi:hypothetical protein